MKIGISAIVRDHMASLYDARSQKLSKFDVVLFYIMPLVAGGFCYLNEFTVAVDIYNVSITFFGIFIALLLNIQVAIFSIFQRKWEEPDDDRLARVQEKVLKARRSLLTELNANISYLILVSCAALVIVLILYVQKSTIGIWPSLCVFMYLHFLFTLLMIVKRAHALFQKEYRDSPP